MQKLLALAQHVFCIAELNQTLRQFSFIFGYPEVFVISFE